MNSTHRISAEQLKEGFDWIGQPRVSNLDTAETDLAGLHLEILERLAGTDPDDLATVTRGRVTCPVEHRAALRDLIARPVALEPGMVLPWRLVGSFAGAKCWANRAPIQAPEKDDWPRPAAGTPARCRGSAARNPAPAHPAARTRARKSRVGMPPRRAAARPPWPG